MADAATSSSRTAIHARPIFEFSSRRITKIVISTSTTIVKYHGFSSEPLNRSGRIPPVDRVERSAEAGPVEGADAANAVGEVDVREVDERRSACTPPGTGARRRCGRRPG